MTDETDWMLKKEKIWVRSISFPQGRTTFSRTDCNIDNWYVPDIYEEASLEKAQGGLFWNIKRTQFYCFIKFFNDHEIIPFLWIGNWSKTYIIGASVGHLSWSLCRGLFQLFFPLQHFFRASLHPKTTIRGAAPNSTQLWSTLLILLNPEFDALSAF